MSTKLSRRAALLGAALIAFVGWTATSDRAYAQTTLERLQNSGVVRIGFANEAPYGYATPEGEVTGEAPEIAKVILSKMGIETMDGVILPFRSLVSGLQAGRFDIIAAGMYVTPARCEQVLFTEPTYSMGQAMIVLEGNPKDIHSFGDFVQNTDLRLGVLGGGQAHKLAQAVGITDDQISIYPDGPSGRAAVEAGRVDAWTMTGLAVQRLLDSAGDAPLERATPFEEVVVDGEVTSRGHGAFAFRKEDTAFHAEFNKDLQTFIGTPEHKQLVREFGFTESERPTKTTAELCAGG